MMKDVVKELQERDLLSFSDDDEFLKELSKRPVTLYIGFDPTGPSLHCGSLLPVMGLAHFQRCGHKPICLVGGGTGLIGDPSGKSEERVLLTVEKTQENAEKLKVQLSRFLDFDESKENCAVMANNFEWLGQLSLIDYLRDVGKFFRVNEMMHKESVKKRIDSEVGISLTEFCYQTLQAYDFYELNKRYGCELQAGGSDQWGNIAAGIDLIRRMYAVEGSESSESTYKPGHGVCFPLLLKADGTKFGKTESGAVWLDPEMTSPFEFYQFWVRSDDRDVIKYLKYFTFLELDEIAKLEESLESEPEKRMPHKRLAFEVTAIVHGEQEATNAKEASEKLYSGDLTGLSEKQLATIFPDVPSTPMPRTRLDEGVALVDVLAETNLCKSKGDARRQIKSGGVYLNDKRQTDTERILTAADLASEKTMILRRGKKSYHLVRFE